MADRVLTLCEPLCFLINRYGKYQLNLLKSIIADFYSADCISAAKTLLLDDVSSLTLSFKLPHISKHHNTEHRVMMDIDDIITIISCLDENKALDSLPCYVAADLDYLPPVRLMDSVLKYCQFGCINWKEKLISVAIQWTPL